MKYLVIAHHHGAFLAIKQLKEWKLDFVVLVPQSQIDKYAKMDGAVFKNFEKNIRTVVGKSAEIHVLDYAGKISDSHRFLRSIGAEGKWTVLQAGSLLTGISIDFKQRSAVGMVKARVHPKFTKLYKMIGQEEKSDRWFGGAWFIDMSMPEAVEEVASDMCWRADDLYAKSFATLWCIRYRQMINEAVTMSFWMEVIKGTQTRGEWVAYPYHIYGEYAAKVKKYLPKQTYEAIAENARWSESVNDFVQLDL